MGYGFDENIFDMPERVWSRAFCLRSKAATKNQERITVAKRPSILFIVSDDHGWGMNREHWLHIVAAVNIFIHLCRNLLTEKAPV